MRPRSRSGAIVAVAVLGTIIVGCGSAGTSSAPSAEAPPAGGSIGVSLVEWSVVPATASAAAGTVTFDVSNDGTQVHEFVVVKTDTAADALTVVDNKIDESVLTPVDEIEDIAVGATPSLTVDLAAGHYVLLCNIETHYEQGMRADFDVE
jgi:uncharacterized cupredoxin-like copper-binding protein